MIFQPIQEPQDRLQQSFNEDHKRTIPSLAPPMPPNKKQRVVSHGSSASNGAPASNAASASNAGHSWWRFGEFQREVVQKAKEEVPGILQNNVPVPNNMFQQQQQPQLSAPNIQFLQQPQQQAETDNMLRTDNMVSQFLALQQQATQDPQTQVQYNPSRSVEEEELSGTAESSADDSLKFRAYQAENWTERFEELLEFRSRIGHCLVPNNFPVNPPLAQWVKRQRYQYKLKQQSKRSTMSDERVQALEEIGFVWDSHSACWDEKLEELLQYREVHGHCNVPSRFAENRQMAVWVKRQRRQYKFYCEGKASSMTEERIAILEGLGFQWDLRGKK
jgi:hypothetical protein